MKRKIRMCLVALLCVTAIWAKELKTVTFNVPQMVCENCEAKVMKNLRFEKGVKEIKADVEKKTVTVTYDSEKTTPEKIQKGFSKFKYEATIAGEKTPDSSK